MYGEPAHRDTSSDNKRARLSLLPLIAPSSSTINTARHVLGYLIILLFSVISSSLRLTLTHTTFPFIISPSLLFLAHIFRSKQFAPKYEVWFVFNQTVSLIIHIKWCTIPLKTYEMRFFLHIFFSFFARVVSVDAKHAGSVINGFCE